MRRFFAGISVVAAVGALSAAVWLWTPAPTAFDIEGARTAAKAYDARIIRDRWGVPHVYGIRDADTAFGLAYAHAEDDWKTFEDVILFSRGALAAIKGREAAVTDYLVAALGANDAIARDYAVKLSPETHAVLEAYAAGLNLYCAEVKARCSPGVAPVTPQDIVAGFAVRTPFFYGLDENLKTLFDGDSKKTAALDWTRTALLRIAKDAELGSNAMAISPGRSADGATRLMVNSHQPFTGPVAWYEARLKSEEGLDIIGGVFPGSPVILHGATPDLGWAFTVNKPDLVDVYEIDTVRRKNPLTAQFDGNWKEFERGKADFRLKLFGPFSLPVRRPVLRTVHGPAFETPAGWRAVAFAGDGEIRAVEQWRLMNKAKNFEGWRSAMAMQAIPSFNAVFAERGGVIAFFYNMAAPVRSADHDWSLPAPGDRADLVWRGVLPFGTAPFVVEPSSGYIINANNEPWKASSVEDSPKVEDYPPQLGVRARSTNRGLRLQELFAADYGITEEKFLEYKMDDAYSPQSNIRQLISAALGDASLTGEDSLAEALELLARWDGRTNRENRSAALAVTFGRYALGILLNGDEVPYPDPFDALTRAAADLKAGFGRLEPEWGEVNRLIRGDVSLPLNGGPDTLRAIYSISDIAKGPSEAVAGDTYIMLVEWPENDPQRIRTIHQFGAATLDASSPHYADQAPLFAAEEFKEPAMTLEALLTEATRDYRPGR